MVPFAFSDGWRRIYATRLQMLVQREGETMAAFVGSCFGVIAVTTPNYNHGYGRLLPLLLLLAKLVASRSAPEEYSSSSEKKEEKGLFHASTRYYLNQQPKGTVNI